eukprot:TRINITY_DN7346_c0_g4_i1.p3 TRINITY_DN7346_c0_g4~~TRINITY_DN7346_c0_g4_i1.p3  ORF type:complete len:112 (+),score=11.14 TRINITY_DN7346_c0_g4_i1:488-823(+)
MWRAAYFDLGSGVASMILLTMIIVSFAMWTFSENQFFFQHHLALPSIQPNPILPNSSNSQTETRFTPRMVHVRRNTYSSSATKQLPPESAPNTDPNPPVFHRSSRPIYPPN